MPRSTCRCLTHLFHEQICLDRNHADCWQQVQTQQLFARAIREAASGVSPANVFALEVSSGINYPQTAFLILSKSLD